MNNWVGGELPQSFCLPLWLRTIRGRSLLGRSGLYKNRKADLDGSASVCWSTRIRTWNDRTRICSVTITPYSKVASTVSFPICAAKVRTFLEPPNVFSIFFAKNAIFLQNGLILGSSDISSDILLKAECHVSRNENSVPLHLEVLGMNDVASTYPLAESLFKPLQ